MADLYVVQTTSHLVKACTKCMHDDFIICVGSISKKSTIKKILNSCFLANNIATIHSLDYYKSNLSRLFFFRRIMKKSLDPICHNALKTIYVFNDVDPIVQWILHYLLHQNTVLIEEGIGLYRNTVKRSELFFKYFGKLFFGNKFENINRIGISKIVDTIECSFPCRLNSKQKEKKIIEKTHPEKRSRKRAVR